MGLGIWLQELGLHGWLGCRLAWLKGSRCMAVGLGYRASKA